MCTQDYNKHNGICPNSKNVTRTLGAQEWSLWKPGHEVMGRLPSRFMSLRSNVICLGCSLLMTTGHSPSTKQLAACILVQYVFGTVTLRQFYRLDWDLMNSNTCPRSHANKQQHQNSSGIMIGSCPWANVKMSTENSPLPGLGTWLGSLTFPKGHPGNTVNLLGEETPRASIVLPPKPLKPTPPHLSKRAWRERLPLHWNSGTVKPGQPCTWNPTLTSVGQWKDKYY